MAAERTGRRARLLEIDPGYVDVIVERWQSYTGRQATLAGIGHQCGDASALDLIGWPLSHVASERGIEGVDKSYQR